MRETTLPKHAALNHFNVVDDCLQIGDRPLTRIVDQVGQTPFYAYDRGLLTERVNTLKHALPSEISLHYAMKANPMPALVQHMTTLVDGLDVASTGEMRIALDTGISPKKNQFRWTW